MPALTHNRVKNGFNGGIRKNNATAGTKHSRTLGSAKADATRSKALVGRIGSVPANIRAAYNRRVRCKCKNKIDTIKPLLVSLVQITTPGTNVTPSFDFSSNEVGTITSNYVFTSTTNAVVGSNTITFYNLASGTYSDVFVQVTDLVGNMSKKLILESFVINDAVPPVLSAVTQIATPANDSTPSFIFTSDEAGTITSSHSFTSTTSAISGNNTITFSQLADGTYSGLWVKVTDATLNVSNQLTLVDFVIETAPPVLSALTQIATPGNDSTPSFVFNSNEAGTITSSHAFTSITSATVGSNTITFSPLDDGTYSGLWVKVTDSLGNISNQLTLADFVIETVSPTIGPVTPIATPGNDSTPSFVFTSTKAGTITSSHVFTPTTSATVGSNTITFSTLADGTYSGFWVKVTDSLGNISNQLTLADFVIDTVSPTIGPVTPITTPTTDNTPSFVFTSNEAGTITSSHAFTSTTSATVGSNTITFSPLADGPYNTVWVKVTDAAGNVSNQLPLDPFTVDTNTECLTLNTSVNVVLSGGNKYVFNGGTTYNSSKKYGLNNATYTFKDIPIAHPLAILNNGNANITYTGDVSKKFSKPVSSTTSDGTYDFYHGDVTVNVTGDFGNVSVYCYYHGYMGGENLLKYKSTCSP